MSKTTESDPLEAASAKGAVAYGVQARLGEV